MTTDKNDNNNCQHYWRLTDGNGYIRGVCQLCGAVTIFPAELPWDFLHWRPATPVLDFMKERAERV